MDKVNSSKGKVIYLSHGGGPLPILGDPSHDKMVKFMQGLSQKLGNFSAVVVFSAHWEEDNFAIQNGDKPSILYDYYGFPQVAYKITYPCSGNPILAEKIAQLLYDNGLAHSLDKDRPYDHGSYIPLLLMYPNYVMPVIQISLHSSLDPLAHLRLGKALQPLLGENILFIGSGFSFHNMRKFDFAGGENVDTVNDSFQDSLIDVCTAGNDKKQVWDRLVKWKELPGAKYCHPREEHLVPLFVCAGLGESPGKVVFDDYILGKRAVAFLWE